MIRPGFLDIKSRQNLIELARDGSAAHRLARRANALVLLDDGMSCEAIAKVLLLDDDTIRTWYRLYEEDGIEGLTNFSYEGSACQLSGEQQEKLKAWVATSLPRTTRQVGAWIENEFGVVYEGRSGLIALLHRLGLEYHKPNVIPRKLDEEKQRAFIEGYEKLLNSLGDDEAVLFADAVHPTHAARPVGCWAPSQEKLAIEQTSGRQRINIHGAIDLETGQTRMIEALTIDAASTIRLLQSIEALYPMLALIHVFLDNARYHHAKLVQEWLALPGRRIKLHFIPTYCPHLNPIERLWGLMHRNGRSSDAAIIVFSWSRRYHHAKLRAGMVGPAGTAHEDALHPNVLPALEPDRTVMGPHAQKRHSQQVRRNLRPVRQAHGEFESEHPGYCGAQDTFYVGNLKGVGRVYQQTFIDTYAKVAFAKLYDRKTPITAADLLNDRVISFFPRSVSTRMSLTSWLSGDDGVLNLLRHTVLQHGLLTTDLLQRQLAACVVEFLEAVEAVARIAHHLAGLANIAELFGKLKQSNLGTDDLLFVVMVSSNAPRRGASPPRPLRAPPRLAIRRGEQDTSVRLSFNAH